MERKENKNILLKKDLSREQKAKAQILIKGELAHEDDESIIFFCEWDKNTFLKYG